MPTKNNPNQVAPIIDYVLKDISLDDGMNTRGRQEAVDWTKFFTNALNVVVDNDGALVKRPGMTTVGANDDAGNAYNPCYRALNVNGALTIIGKKFGVYTLDSNSGKLSLRGQFKHSEFGIEQYPFASYGGDVSGVVTASTASTGNMDRYGMICSSTISSKYTFAIVQEVEKTDPKLYVVDRITKATIKKYSIADATTVLVRESIKMCIVDDRYLHVAVKNNAAVSPCKLFIIDTNSLPNSLVGITIINTLNIVTGISDGVDTIVGMIPYIGKSAIVIADDTDNSTSIYTLTNAGTLSTVLTITTWLAGGVSDANNQTDLYVASVNATPRLEIKRINISGDPSLTSTTTDTNDFPAVRKVGSSLNNVRIAVTSSKTAILATTSTKAGVAGSDAKIESIVTIYVPNVDIVGGQNFSYKAAIPDWQMATQPFIDRSTDIIYLGVSKLRKSAVGNVLGTREDLGAFCIIEISPTQTPTGVSYGSNSPVYSMHRLCAVLDPLYNARTTYANLYGGGTNSSAGQQVFVSNKVFFVAVEAKATGYSRSYYGNELHTFDPAYVASANEAISGGAISSFDGSEVIDMGFVDCPSLYGFESGVAGGPAAGTYSYTGIFTYTDANGRAHYSRTSRILTIVSAAGNQIKISVSNISVGKSAPAYNSAINNYPNFTFNLYRTKAGGSDYYFHSSPLPVGNIAYGAGVFTGQIGWEVVDTTSDATLGTKPKLFRQPGQVNTPLDRYYPVGSGTICKHKDRLFIAQNSNIYYSSFAVDGEAPWFNPTFGFPVPGGSGSIISIGSMDGQLIVFKRDAIFIVDGDGPPENGGNGTEYSTPRRLNTQFGCIDQRSLVNTPDGIMFRSPRGIELLTRSLQLIWIGENVQDTVNANPYTGGGTFDLRNSRVYYSLSKTLSGTQANPNDTGIELVYDTLGKAWYSGSRANGTITPGAMQDVVYGKVYATGITDPSHRLLWATAVQAHIDQDSLTKTDNGTYIPIKLETGWVKLDSSADRLRASDMFILAKPKTNHALKVSVAYDYSSIYSYSKTWQPDVIPSTLEEMQLQIPSGAKQAIRFKIEDLAPTDLITYPITTGHGPEIFGITVKLGKRGGGAKLPPAQRG